MVLPSFFPLANTLKYPWNRCNLTVFSSANIKHFTKQPQILLRIFFLKFKICFSPESILFVLLFFILQLQHTQSCTLYAVAIPIRRSYTIAQTHLFSPSQRCLFVFTLIYLIYEILFSFFFYRYSLVIFGFCCLP